MSEEGRSASTVVVVIGGLIIGAIETVLACALAALVFGAFADGDYIVRGVNLYLGAAVLTVAFLAWTAGRRSSI